VPFAPPLDLDLPLVPSARLGAALHRARTRSGATMAALARDSAGRFLPDDLVLVERGAVEPTDDTITALVGLYGLSGRPLPTGASIELVLDRSPSTLVGRSSDAATTGGAASTGPEWVAARLVALSVLLGLDVTTGLLGTAVVSEALERPPTAVVELIDDVLHRYAPEIGGIITRIEQRVVVPAAGILVAETPMGSLLVTDGRAPHTTGAAPACGRLADLVDAART